MFLPTRSIGISLVQATEVPNPLQASPIQVGGFFFIRFHYQHAMVIWRVNLITFLFNLFSAT